MQVVAQKPSICLIVGDPGEHAATPANGRWPSAARQRGCRRHSPAPHARWPRVWELHRKTGQQEKEHLHGCIFLQPSRNGQWLVAFCNWVPDFTVSKWNFIDWVVAWAGIICWEWVTVQNWLWVLVLFREVFGNTFVSFLQNWYFGIWCQLLSSAVQKLLINLVWFTWQKHVVLVLFSEAEMSVTFYFLTEQKQPVSMSLLL